MPDATEAQKANRVLFVGGAGNPAEGEQHQEKTYRAVYSTTVLVCSIETGESGKRLGMVSFRRCGGCAPTMARRSAVATAYLKSTSAKLFTNLSLIVGAENLGIHSQHLLVSAVAWN